MKTLYSEVQVIESKFFIKKVRVTQQVVNNCSWRRAKTLAKGLFLKGGYRKNNVKWTNYVNQASYSRKNRRLYLINRELLSKIEQEDTCNGKVQTTSKQQGW